MNPTPEILEFTPRRPFRVGIWCDYGYVTLIEQGIGIFVQNLVRGLLDLSEDVEVALLVRPGDAQLGKLVELKQKGGTRLQIVPEQRESSLDVRLGLARAAVQGVEQRLARIAASSRSVRARAKAVVESLARRVLRRPRSARQAAVCLWGAPLLATLAAAAALLFPCWRLLRALGQTALFPLRAIDNVLQMAADRPRSPETTSAVDRARSAECDAWVIPYDGFDWPLDFPSVLVIHDLVHVHFRDTFPAEVLERLEAIIPQRAAEATLCACMSDFILHNDLEGVLRLPPSKTRRIRPAAPEDFPEVSAADVRRLRPPQLNRPFVLFPAAFRPYKNHRLLVEMLRELEAEGEDWLDLVFTGFASMPSELAELVARRRLEGRVHTLGFVDRRTLAVLYSRAFATLVPSLYEQGSFPIYEALAWKCPAACSSIPALREQCASLGDAMLYFDPHDPREAARVVLEIRDRRAEIIAAQQAAKAALWQRTWRDAAGEWLSVLREAAALHPGIGSLASPRAGLPRQAA